MKLNDLIEAKNDGTSADGARIITRISNFIDKCLSLELAVEDKDGNITPTNNFVSWSKTSKKSKIVGFDYKNLQVICEKDGKQYRIDPSKIDIHTRFFDICIKNNFAQDVNGELIATKYPIFLHNNFSNYYKHGLSMDNPVYIIGFNVIKEQVRVHSLGRMYLGHPNSGDGFEQINSKFYVNGDRIWKVLTPEIQLQNKHFISSNNINIGSISKDNKYEVTAITQENLLQVRDVLHKIERGFCLPDWFNKF